MDTKNWFGEHAASIRLIALAGGIALAAIILLDILTHKKNASGSTTNGAAPATGLDTSPATSGTSGTSTLQNPGETYISILEDYSSHVSNDTTTTNPAGPYLPIRPIGHPILGNPLPVRGVGHLPPTLSGPVAAQPIVATASPSSPHGGPVPVPTPHPSEQYTVKSGDTLWGIAQRFLGNGADWRELYNYNRSTVGSNPNRIYPGEVLSIQN